MRNMSLEAKVQKLLDIREIENLMAKYAYLHRAGKHEEVAALFAQKTPGVRVELSSRGVFEGNEGVVRAMVKTHRSFGMGAPGQLFVHTQSTPVIEVAGDGKTAKGVWMSPGMETKKDPDTGKFTAYWIWGDYGVDFVKEDGKWKFWHFHVYAYIDTPYDQSWVTQQPFEPEPIPAELRPDRPVSCICRYTTNAEMRYIPAPPEPYETFDEKTAY